MEVQWLALLPHSKQVHNLCGVWTVGGHTVSGVRCDWLSVSLCQPCITHSIVSQYFNE